MTDIWYYIKTVNGFEYGLNGIYLSSDETKRLVFEPDYGSGMTGSICYESYDSSTDSWTIEADCHYFKYNNKYYICGFRAIVSEDTITLGNGDVYTKLIND